MNFPVLSVITFTPMVAAVLILLLPAQRKNEVRAVALAAATFALILSFWVYLQLRSGSWQVINSSKNITGFPRLASACTLAWTASARRSSC